MPSENVVNSVRGRYYDGITLNYHCVRKFSSSFLLSTFSQIEPIFPQFSDHVRKLTMYRCRFPDMSVLQGVEQEFDCFRDVASHQQHCKEFVASFVPDSQVKLWFP